MSSTDHQCFYCKERLSGTVSKAQGNRYHQDCFRCASCSNPIEKSYITRVRDGTTKFYDQACYNKEFGMDCEVCGSFITGHVLKYNGKSYHYGCLSCLTCNEKFSDGASVTVKGGRFFHADCRKKHKGVTKGDVQKVSAMKKKFDTEESFKGDLGEFEQTLLEGHNALRENHGAVPLEWSVQCAEHARQWVEHLKEMDCLAHDCSSGMGENCGYFMSSSVQSKTDTTWAENTCAMWYDEEEKYDYAVKDYQVATGHFSQMIWKDTQKMGCAIVKTDKKVYVVANYYPPGNFIGKYADNVRPRKNNMGSL